MQDCDGPCCCGPWHSALAAKAPFVVVAMRGAWEFSWPRGILVVSVVLLGALFHSSLDELESHTPDNNRNLQQKQNRCYSPCCRYLARLDRERLEKYPRQFSNRNNPESIEEHVDGTLGSSRKSDETTPWLLDCWMLSTHAHSAKRMNRQINIISTDNGYCEVMIGNPLFWWMDECVGCVFACRIYPREMKGRERWWKWMVARNSTCSLSISLRLRCLRIPKPPTLISKIR